MIRDLLNPSSGYLELREDSRGVCTVAGLTEVSARSTEEVNLDFVSKSLSYIALEEYIRETLDLLEENKKLKDLNSIKNTNLKQIRKIRKWWKFWGL